MTSKRQAAQRGFTLIELLVVIAIIGILASLVLVALGSAREKARNARIKADVEQTRVLAEDVNDSNGGTTYTGATCAGNATINRLCVDIDAQNGAAGGVPTLTANDQFCVSAVLADSTTYCADSTGIFTGTFDGGGGAGDTGTCGGTPAACT